MKCRGRRQGQITLSVLVKVLTLTTTTTTTTMLMNIMNACMEWKEKMMEKNFEKLISSEKERIGKKSRKILN